MPVTLGESRRIRKPMTVGTLVSLILHVSVLAAAVVGTGLSETQRVIEEHPTTVVYTPTQSHPMSRTSGERPSFQYARPLPHVPVVGELNASLSGPVVSTDLAVSSYEGATEFRAAKLSDLGLADPSRNLTSVPFDANTVETPVHPHGQNQTPRYPALLAAAGIEGGVVARYVVDTLGMVESSSITIVSSTHPQFERAVRDVLPYLRFDPAEVRGHKVRQLVEQAFGFELKR